MKYRIPTIALAAAAVIACSETQTEPTEGLAPELNEASGCYAVKFKVAGAPGALPWIVEHEITGDLEGSATTVFDIESLRFTGHTVSNTGTWYLNITGGIIPGLTEFEARHSQRNQLIDNPATPGTVFENHGTLRALSGVRIANLTYHGTYWALPYEHGEWEVRGVICP